LEREEEISKQFFEVVSRFQNFVLKAPRSARFARFARATLAIARFAGPSKQKQAWFDRTNTTIDKETTMDPLVDTSNTPSGDKKSPAELGPRKRKRGRQPKPKNPADLLQPKRKRGRPPKPKNPAEPVRPKRKPRSPRNIQLNAEESYSGHRIRAIRIALDPKKTAVFDAQAKMSNVSYYARNLGLMSCDFLSSPVMQAIVGRGETTDLDDLRSLLNDIRGAAQRNPKLFAAVAWCSFPFFPRTTKNFLCLFPYCPWCAL